MRTNRSFSAASLIIAGALLAAPVTAATAAPAEGSARDVRATARPVAPVEPLIPMAEVRVADFAAEAAELPPQLEQALARDVGMTGAEWLAQAEASAVGVEVVDALRDHVDVRAARLDGLELVVTVGSTADAAVVESVGARAEIGPEPARESLIEGVMPAADLRGGLPYIYNSRSFRCSIGFVGVDVTTEQTQVMSAGHCEGDGGFREVPTISRPVYAGGTLGSPYTPLGDAGLHVTDDYPNPGFPADATYYDLGLTPVTGGGWTPKSEVVTWGGGTSGAPLASTPLIVRDAGPAMNGATLCKSGSTTGWTCGVIPVDNPATVPNESGVDRVQYVGTGTPTCPAAAPNYCVGSILANICVRGGDSGGAALVGTRAVGIVSASSTTNPATACSSGDIGVFATLYSANPAYEQVTKVYPNWEPLIGLARPTVSTGGANRLESSIGGTLTGAGTRHDVRLALDLGGPLTDEVNASGAWSINLGAVPNGTRTYSLTSSWGSGVQQSAATTGRFLKAAATRLAGSDRYATSIVISQYGFPGTSTPTGPVVGGVPVVYLANGANFPDALSAGPAAKLEGGPLLLTPAGSLPSAVAAELDRLNPQEIVIVGGPSVVSEAVRIAAAAYTTGDVVRLGGSDRYETSRLIAARMLSQGLATGSKLWVATGSNFPDALAAGSAAAGQGVPILLVNGARSTLDPTTATFVNSTLRSSEVFIAGSAAVVTEGIRTSLVNLASTTSVQRAGGSDRFGTAVEINEIAYPVSAPKVFLSYGFNFPDALSGSVIAGQDQGPLYITPTGCVPPAIVDQILDLGPSQVIVFGSAAVVANAARDLTTC